MSRQKRIEQLESAVEYLNDEVQRLRQFIDDLHTDEVPCNNCGHRTTGPVCLYCENLFLQVQVEEAQINLEAQRAFILQPHEN